MSTEPPMDPPVDVPMDEPTDLLMDLPTDLRRAARLFRLGMEADGSEVLVRVVDGLLLFLDAADPGAARHVQATLPELVSAQERGDGLRIADLLEFELLPRCVAAQGTRP